MPNTFPWLPVTGLTYASMDLVANFVTGLTDNGGGDYTYTLDGTAFAATPGGSDIHAPIDFITAWVAAGVNTYMLEFRTTVIARPDDDTGRIYIAPFIQNGAALSRGASAATMAGLVFDSAGDWVNDNSNMGTALPAGGTSMGTPTSVILRHETPTTSPRQEAGLTVRAIGGTPALVQYEKTFSAVALPTTTTLAAGYAVAGGCIGGIVILQRAASTATTMRLRHEYRIVPRVWPPIP